MRRILVHIITGDGDYIAEVVHSQFVELDLAIREKYPRLYVPSLPQTNIPRDQYKGLIYDYFAVCV